MTRSIAQYKHKTGELADTFFDFAKEVWAGAEDA